MEVKKLNQYHQEREDQGRRYQVIAGIANELLGETALVQEQAFQSSDVARVRTFFVEAAPYVGNRLYPDYWEHILLASLNARKIAERVRIKDPDVNPHEGEAMAFLHDAGRLIAPHRYFRNDVIGKVLARKVGVRQCVYDILAPLDRILGIKDPIEGVEDLTLAQKIDQVADNLGKRRGNGELFRPEDIMTLNSGSRYKDPVWPSERVALEHLNRLGKEEWANKLVYWETLFFKMEYGIDFDEVREEVEREFQTSENQRWLQTAQYAQETLDPRIDEKLGRPSIKQIVFDIGGVLLQASEQEIMAAIGKKLNVAPDKLHPAFQRYYKSDVMAGRVSETELADILSSAVSKKIAGDAVKEIFNNPEIYQPVEGMQGIVGELLQNSSLQIVVFTDSIAPVADPIREALQRFYPEIERGQIIISSEVGNSKAGGDAYVSMLSRLQNPDPQSVLFIDDKQEYTTRARANTNMRGFTFRGNPYNGITATQRLQKELQSAGLLN